MPSPPQLTPQEMVERLQEAVAELKALGTQPSNRFTDTQLAQVEEAINKVFQERVGEISAQNSQHTHGGEASCEECQQVANTAISSKVQETIDYYENIPGVKVARETYEAYKANGVEPDVSLHLVVEG